MAILMSRSGREQFLTALHLESLTRYLAAYLAYVPASWQCSSHLHDLAILIDDEKMCSGLRV